MKNIPEDCSKYLAPPNFLLNFSIDVAQKIPQGTIIDTDYPTVLRFELCVVSSETVAKKLSVFQKSLDWLPKISSIGGIALDDCSIFRLIKAYDG